MDDTKLLFEDEGNNLALVMHPFKMEELSDGLHNLLGFETYSKNITLCIDSHETQAYINGNKKRLFHIIYTLLSNAFKYTISGQIMYSYEVVLRESIAYVDITVSDTGLGMGQNEFENL